MENLNDRIKQFLKISVDESEQPFSWDNGNGYGEGYGYGKAVGGGLPSGICLCDNGKDGSSKLDIKETWGYPIFQVDDIPTVIENVRGNIAKGYILLSDMSLKPCYIAKVGNMFAHGTDAHKAYQDALEKAIKAECVECVADYVNYVVNKYPDVDALIDNKELYELHNLITGSCDMGRSEFINERNIDMDGKTSMRDFLKLVQYSYGKERILDIMNRYGITE